jgi:hypothetical protein
VGPQKEGEKPKVFRKPVYDPMYALSRDGREKPEMRSVRHYSETDWKRVWTNLHDSGIWETITAVWYAVIYDILPTNVRLHNIQLADTPMCKECGAVDTRLDRLIECGDGRNIWDWTRQRIAWIIRTTPERIPAEWLLRPQFQIWPPRRNRTVL